MTRPLLLAALLCILAAPLAHAQVLGSSVTIVLTPPDRRLVEDDVLGVAGTLVYTADQTAQLNVQGIPVTYTITAAPEWLGVVASPATDVLPVHGVVPGSASFTVTRTFTLTMLASPDLDRDAVGVVEVTATVTPSGPFARPSTATAAIPVAFDAGEEDCPEPAHAAAIVLPAPVESEPAEAEADEPTTTVQSSATTPVAVPIAAVAGFGAVGAGVGLLLRRRRG